MVNDLYDLFSGTRIMVEGGYGLTWFGLVDNCYYDATYDLGDGLGGFLNVTDTVISIVVLPRDSKILDSSRETFADRIKFTIANSDRMKYVDFR